MKKKNKVIDAMEHVTTNIQLFINLESLLKLIFYTI